jgi:hypothetical protein
MLSATLRLRAAINDPSLLDMSGDYMQMDELSPPTLLVLEERLANEVLKSDAFHVFNLIDYWKIVANKTSLPTIETLFRKTPFFLYDENHRTIRKTLTHPYRRIENALADWLPQVTRNFFDAYPAGTLVSPVKLCADYINRIFNEILSREVDAGPGELEIIEVRSTPFFVFFPRPEHIITYEEKLTRLADKCEQCLVAAGKDTNDLYAILSVMVMAREPLFGSFVHALVNQPESGHWTAESLLKASAPVSLLGRQAVKDVELRGYRFYQGQAVHIAPFLVNEKIKADGKDGHEFRSLEFGAGVHLCSGRNMSIKITDIFLSHWSETRHIELDVSSTGFYRDFNLVPKDAKP